MPLKTEVKSRPSQAKFGFGMVNPNDRSSSAANALQDRLHDLQIFELAKNGSIQNLSLTVRGLYQYVMDSIVAFPRQVDQKISERKINEDIPSDNPDNENDWRSRKRQRSRKKKKTKANHVTYHERLGGFLHPRDMRRLTTPLSASNEPEIMVRRHVMLFSFNPVRAIVTRDRMLLVLPEDKEEADWIVDHLVTTIQGKPVPDEEEKEKTESNDGDEENPQQRDNRLSWGLFGKLKMHSSRLLKFDTEMTEGDESEEDLDDDRSDDEASSDAEEWDEMKRRRWIRLPFELQCADSILFCINERLERDTRELRTGATISLYQIINRKNMGDDHFGLLRLIKDARQELASRVKGFCSSLIRVLNEDEDMALMNLSRLLTHPENFVQPVSQEILENESDEPELILESHLQAGYTLLNTLNLIEGQLESASDFYEQQLDATRNKILLANMLLTTASLCLTAASVVGSFLGMNVTVPGDGEPGFFTPIVATTMGGALLLGILILATLVASGTIQRSPVYVVDGSDM